LCDLLWSDPDKEIGEFDENDRGVSVIFGEKVVADFNRKNDLDLIIRAHQVHLSIKRRLLMMGTSFSQIDN